MYLTGTTHKLQMVLGGAVTANQLEWMTAHADHTVTSFTPGAENGQSNGTTDVDIVSAPGASTQRQVKWISIYNKDTAQATVTVKLDISGTERILVKATLEVGETLEWLPETGWTVRPADIFATLGQASQGDILYRGASAWTRLAAGNAGQHLQTNGAGANPAWGLGGSPSVMDFRLTLASGSPVMVSDQLAKTTLFCSPYSGNHIGLYNGTRWNVRSSAEFSVSLAGLTANTNYDVWCYDNSGTPTLELLAWSGDTTRATGLARQDGIIVKSGDATRRYAGMIRITGTTGQCEFSFIPAAAAGGANPKLYVWNMYNRVDIAAVNRDSTDFWNYSTATLRAKNGSNNNRIALIRGLDEDVVDIVATTACQNDGTSGAPLMGIGLDSTSASVNGVLLPKQNFAIASDDLALNAFYAGLPGAGFHFFQELEQGGASGTTQWIGDAAASGVVQTGMILKTRM